MSEVDKSLNLRTRSKPQTDYVGTTVRVWSSTYEKLVKIKGKMEAASGESTSLAQVIDALARAVEPLKIEVTDDEDVSRASLLY